MGHRKQICTIAVTLVMAFHKGNDIRDGCGLVDDPSGISTAPQSFRSPQETPFSHAMKVVRSLALVRGSRS